MSPDDVTDAQLLACGLVGKSALTPKSNKYAERMRIEALDVARSAYVRRVSASETKIKSVDPSLRAKILAKLEAVYGDRNGREALLAAHDGLQTLVQMMDIYEQRERMILAMKGTIQGLLYTEKNASRRRAMRIKLATPAWVDFDEIALLVLERDRLEAETGEAHHIDHIVPIAGRNVCGLHVHHNMRVIPAIDNLRKNNKFAT